MIRLLRTLGLAGLLCVAAVHASTLIAGKDAQRDLRILKVALTELHPAVYRHLTPAQLDAEFEQASAQVASGTDRATMYLLASRLAASLRCGHTWTNYLNQSDAVTADLFERGDKLPLTLRLIGGRMLIDGSAVDGLAAGEELLAIDDRDVSSIVQELLPYLRADAQADGKRLAQIDHGENGGAMDRLFPLLHPPLNDHYTVRVRGANGFRTLTLAPMTASARTATLTQHGITEPSSEWTFRIDRDVAVLTLPTFTFWNSRFDWKAYLKDAFDQLRRRNVAVLIIDIRRNEGGDDAVGRELLSYVLRRPYTLPAGRVESAYERVPYKLARFLDTWDFSFFDRTGRVVKGEGRNWVLREQPPPRTLVPAAHPFRGTTLMLVGPNNSSAGFLLARDAKASQAALLVGRPTAGSQRGLNGGELAWITLPASGVAVDIPLIATIHDDQPDAGVVPDVVVEERFEDAQVGIDTEMKAAQALRRHPVPP